MSNKEIYKLEDGSDCLVFRYEKDYNEVYISLDNMEDFSSIDMSRREAIKMAKTILKELDE